MTGHKEDTEEDSGAKDSSRDEELAIDFGKITGFFRKKKKEISEEKENRKEDEEYGEKDVHLLHQIQHHTHHGTQYHKEEKETEEKDSEELSVDIKGLWHGTRAFFSKYGIVFLILIPFLFSVFLRMQPAYLPITDRWAENNINTMFRSQIETQINQMYPNLPPENKEKIINSELQKAIEGQVDSYEQAKKANSEYLKAKFQDSTGHTYLLELDPYQWLGYAENILEHGHEGDIIKDNRKLDTHMLAPHGKEVPKTLFHPRMGAYLYMIVHFFKSNVTPMNVFFFLPVIFASLCVIPAFFIARKVSSNTGGFFAAMVVAMHPSFLTRTVGGFSDTDSYNILFPLLIFWLLYEAFDNENIKMKLVLAGCAGLATGLFSFAWQGWWYIFDFILAFIAIYLLYIMIRFMGNSTKRNEMIKDAAVITAAFILFSCILVTAIWGFKEFTSTVLQPLDFMIIKEAAKVTFWPNVFTTVAEMNEASIDSIIGALGGNFLFAVAVIGLLLLLIKRGENEKAKDKNIRYAMLLLIWMIGTFYASTKGLRFTLIIVPAFAILFGVGVGLLYKLSSEWLSRELQINKNVLKITVVLVFLIVLGFSPIPKVSAFGTADGLKLYEMFCKRGMCGQAINSVINEIPMYTDDWDITLKKIRDNSKEDAIINSWWDYGHWFKYGADRAVTFDGASQNKPQAHWIGKVLLTSDEKEAAGILRMLDCGANDAFDILNNELNNTHKSIDLLYTIIKQDKENAADTLRKNNLPENKIKEVLSKTHCSPPENFFVTSADMIGKSGVWAHFGSWNFERAMIWKNAKGMTLQKAKKYMKEEFGYDDKRAENIYNEIQSIANERQANEWIAPWPGYVSRNGCAPRNNDTELVCELDAGNNRLRFVVYVNDLNVVVENSEEKVHPAAFAYSDTKGFHVKEFKENTVPFGIAVYKKDNVYDAFLMSPELAGSMFTRLYFFGGIGLKYFDFFDHQKTINEGDLYVWKVDWDGKDANTNPYEPNDAKSQQEEIKKIKK